MAVLKRYGVYGLCEWKCIIASGLVTTTVHFTGGRTNALGMAPAEHYTANPIKQAMIENSKEFKSGRIQLLSESPAEDNPRYLHISRPSNARKETPKAESEEEPEEEPVEEEAADEPQQPAPADEAEGNVVSVTCLGDAVAYLNETFNIPKRSLRTRKDVKDAAESCGVIFEGLE